MVKDEICRYLDDKLDKLFESLKEINAKLWIIEDDKRMCEKNSDFSENFIKLSRDVHFLNDDRAKIKLEINNHTGSKIKEIKDFYNIKDKVEETCGTCDVFCGEEHCITRRKDEKK